MEKKIPWYATNKEVDNLIFCRYCGEGQIPETNYKTQLEGEEAATLRCKCDDAKAYQAEVKAKQERKKAIQNIEETIAVIEGICTEQLGIRFNQEHTDLITASALFVLDGAIEKHSFVFWHGMMKLNIAKNAKGKLTLEYAYNQKSKLVVE